MAMGGGCSNLFQTEGFLTGGRNVRFYMMLMGDRMDMCRFSAERDGRFRSGVGDAEEPVVPFRRNCLKIPPVQAVRLMEKCHRILRKRTSRHNNGQPHQQQASNLIA